MRFEDSYYHRTLVSGIATHEIARIAVPQLSAGSADIMVAAKAPSGRIFVDRVILHWARDAALTLGGPRRPADPLAGAALSTVTLAVVADAGDIVVRLTLPLDRTIHVATTAELRGVVDAGDTP